MSRALSILILALAGLFPASGVAAFGLARSVRDAEVVAVENSGPADLVLLDAGFDAGLRRGMICDVVHSGTTVATLLLIDLRPQASTAAITDLRQPGIIQPGDAVTVRLFNS